MAELLTVMVIVGVVAAIAAPRFANAMAEHRARVAGTRVAASLEFARRRAQATGVMHVVQFEANTERYVMVGVPDMDHPARQQEVDLTQPPYESQIISADFGGDDEIHFDGWGAPDSGGTVIVRTGDTQVTVTVDAATGRVTVSEPMPLLDPGEPVVVG